MQIVCVRTYTPGAGHNRAQSQTQGKLAGPHRQNQTDRAGMPSPSKKKASCKRTALYQAMQLAQARKRGSEADAKTARACAQRDALYAIIEVGLGDNDSRDEAIAALRRLIEGQRATIEELQRCRALSADLLACENAGS